MLYDGCCTTWRKAPDGTFARTLHAPARLELRRYAAFGQVQPLATGSAQGNGLVAYVPGTPDIEVGDYLAQGNVAGERPPEGAYRVTSVECWTLFGSEHHAEVSAQ